MQTRVKPSPSFDGVSTEPSGNRGSSGWGNAARGEALAGRRQVGARGSHTDLRTRSTRIDPALSGLDALGAAIYEEANADQSDKYLALHEDAWAGELENPRDFGQAVAALELRAAATEARAWGLESPLGPPNIAGRSPTEHYADLFPQVQQGAVAAVSDANWLNRGVGLLQAIGGVAEIALGAAGIVTPEPATTVGGAVLAAHGADTLAAGLQTLWSGEIHETLTQQGVSQVAEELGADPETADLVGSVVDAGVGIVGSLGVGASIKAAEQTAASTLASMTDDVGLQVAKGSTDDIARELVENGADDIVDDLLEAGVDDIVEEGGRLSGGLYGLDEIGELSLSYGPKTADAIPHVMQDKHAWERLIQISGNQADDFARVRQLLEGEALADAANLVARTGFPPDGPVVWRLDFVKLVDGERVQAVFEVFKDGAEMFLKNAWVITK